MKRALLVLGVLFFFCFLTLVIGLLALAGRGGSSGGEKILVWNLDGALVERAPSRGALPSLVAAPTSLAAVYSRLRSARFDPAVLGLAVHIGEPEIGLAKAEELRRQMRALSAAGKFVECYLETAGEGSNGTLSYFLASGCDRIHLAPAGDLNLLGLYIEGAFLKGTLEKLRVDAEFTTAGSYKSAPETFTRADWSASAEEALAAVLDGDYRVIVDGIAERLGKTPEEVREWIDHAPYGAKDALERGLIDAVSFPDEFEAQLREKTGNHADLVPLEDYFVSEPSFGRRVAVVFASGSITRGANDGGLFGNQEAVASDDFCRTLRSLREDDSIAAVVLRVDSPGGSALASDLILREVELLAAAKPLVASMSDVAASGGYYIVSKAPLVLAEASTLTGSIGVFSGKLATGRFQQELLGISHDTLKRGANADLYNGVSPFTPEQHVQIQSMVDRIYETFLNHVAAGRKLTRDQVHSVAQGRIWAGVDALHHGLVDRLGGLDLAIELAAEKAGLRNPTRAAVAFYPRRPSLFEMLRPGGGLSLHGPLEPLEKILSVDQGATLSVPPDLLSLASPF